NAISRAIATIELGRPDVARCELLEILRALLGLGENPNGQNERPSMPLELPPSEHGESQRLQDNSPCPQRHTIGGETDDRKATTQETTTTEGNTCPEDGE